MYHKIRLNSTYCCAALQKNCTFFTKKRTFVCIKNRKRKAKALRLCGFSVSCCTAAGALCFIRPLPHRRCGVALCHISCCGWDAAFCQTPAALRLRHCVLPYPCCTAAVAPRFVISPAALRPNMPRFAISPAAAATRGVLPDPCRAAVCHAPAPLSAAWLSGSTSNSVRASSPPAAPHTVRIAVKRFSGCA